MYVLPKVWRLTHCDSHCKVVVRLLAMHDGIQQTSRFALIGDVRSGEAILVGLDGSVLKRSCHDSPSLSPCIFEYVYFARPDTILDDVSVYASRLRMGEHLANKVRDDRQ